MVAAGSKIFAGEANNPLGDGFSRGQRGGKRSDGRTDSKSKSQASGSRRDPTVRQFLDGPPAKPLASQMNDPLYQIQEEGRIEKQSNDGSYDPEDDSAND